MSRLHYKDTTGTAQYPATAGQLYLFFEIDNNRTGLEREIDININHS